MKRRKITVRQAAINYAVKEYPGLVASENVALREAARKGYLAGWRGRARQEKKWREINDYPRPFAGPDGTHIYTKTCKGRGK